MDFPPVRNLIVATFDQLSAHRKPIIDDTPPQAPQPVAAGQGMEKGGGLGLNAPTTESTNRVGTVLNAVA